MSQPNNYAVVYYQNEIGVREYSYGYPIEQCKRRIRDYYQNLSDDVDKMSIDQFKKEFLITDRDRPPNQ